MSGYNSSYKSDLTKYMMNGAYPHVIAKMKARIESGVFTMPRLTSNATELTYFGGSLIKDRMTHRGITTIRSLLAYCLPREVVSLIEEKDELLVAFLRGCRSIIGNPRADESVNYNPNAFNTPVYRVRKLNQGALVYLIECIIKNRDAILADETLEFRYKLLLEDNYIKNALEKYKEKDKLEDRL